MAAKKKAKKFHKGDRVEWNSHGGKKRSQGVATGKVVKKLTKNKKIKGHKVKASKKDPQYLVKSDNGGKAAHHPSALRSIAAKPKRTKAPSTKRATKKAASRKAPATSSTRKAACLLYTSDAADE